MEHIKIVERNGSGKPTGRSWKAQEGDHAQRVISRLKGQLKQGSSTYYTRER